MVLKETVAYLAALSKLSLSEEELESLTRDMQSIIGLMDGIKETDTAGLEGTEHVTGLRNVLREDAVVIKENHSDMLKNAPKVIDECFAAPKMIE